MRARTLFLIYADVGALIFWKIIYNIVIENVMRVGVLTHTHTHTKHSILNYNGPGNAIHRKCTES